MLITLLASKAESNIVVVATRSPLIEQANHGFIVSLMRMIDVDLRHSFRFDVGLVEESFVAEPLNTFSLLRCRFWGRFSCPGHTNCFSYSDSFESAKAS